jgi:hypothetical protein
MYRATKKAGIKIALLFVFFMSSVLYSAVLLEADGPGDTYELIESKGYGLEVPDDCGHAVRHISEIWDSELNKYVFVFSIHRDLDDDCITNDPCKQRNEIKTYGPSGPSMYATYGETHIYNWMFKLDSGFQPSSSFTHIHQIKPSGGTDDDNPIITLTPRRGSSGSPDKLQLLYCSGGSTQTVVADANLSLFKGVWVEVYERYLSTDTGTYEIVIRRVSNGAILLSWSNNNIDMWRTGADFNRPKYGIYRSLAHIAYLRDEDVRFADFYLSEALILNPRGLAAIAGNKTVSLTWDDNFEINLDGYNVYRSTTSGSGYSKINGTLVSDSNYIDNTVINGTPYFYVVTAVDTNNNESAYSNEASAAPDYQTCQNVQDANYGLLSDLNGDCYVDFRDVDIIACYWLHTDCAVLNDCEGADFAPTDGTVNFVDFSDFAVDWTRCNNPQDSNCTPNW